jgi:hypothetical protein
MLRVGVKRFVVAGLVILLISLLLAGCGGKGTPTVEPGPAPTAGVEKAIEQPTAETPTEAPTEVPTEAPTAEQAAVPTEEPASSVPTPEDFYCYTLGGVTGASVDLRDLQAESERPLSYVPDQVILTGLEDDIVALVETLLNEDITLEPLEGHESPIVLPPPAGAPVPLATNLYTVTSALTFPETLQIINEVAVSEDKAVIAQPNRIVASPLGIDADPLGIDADAAGIVAGPLGIDADPLGIDADPLGIDADPIHAQLPGEAVFGAWNQWALAGDHGISLYGESAGPPRRNPAADGTYGDGIAVFIFDTSPFPTPGEQSVMGRQLCVYTPALVNEITPGNANVAEHGYFAAGLVRFVAPNSQLHLVRVLNEEGVGDIFSFIVVLNDVMHVRGDMSKSVVNLSLSLRDFEDEETADELSLSDDAVTKLLEKLPAEYEDFILGNEVAPALELLMKEAYSEGAVITAAAGNNSDLDAFPQIDVPTGIPATMTTTVGVAASNIHGDRSCFSNQPEIGLLAPGGDGVFRGPEVGPTLSDAERESACRYPFAWRPTGYECPNSDTSAYDCKYTLTSVVTPATSAAGFAHWLGTSFSTPLVSGIASLMLDAGLDELGGICQSSEIVAWLQNYPGVIQVDDALEYALGGCS